MHDICLRDVIADDLPILFEQQLDPDATRMAAFPSRDRDAFTAHWAKILADETLFARTILFNEEVVGHIGSWERDGKQLVGYWIGKSYWGQGVATKALADFLQVVASRPLFAFVAKKNLGSIRVLEKCGFRLAVEETESLEEPSDGVEEVVMKLA